MKYGVRRKHACSLSVHVPCLLACLPALHRGQLRSQLLPGSLLGPI